MISNKARAKTGIDQSRKRTPVHKHYVMQMTKRINHTCDPTNSPICHGYRRPSITSEQGRTHERPNQQPEQNDSKSNAWPTRVWPDSSTVPSREVCLTFIGRPMKRRKNFKRCTSRHTLTTRHRENTRPIRSPAHTCGTTVTRQRISKSATV